MITALLLAALAAPVQGDHHAAPRPKTSKPAKPAKLKPPPPPEPEEDPYDEPDVPDLPDEPDGAVAADPIKPSAEGANGASGSGQTDRDNPFKSDEEAIGFVVGMGCCCLVMVGGLIFFIVWLVRRSNRASQPQQRPPAAQPPMAATMPPAQAAIPFHLSVFALAVRAPARQQVAQALILAGAQADPITAADRTQLVRELARALSTLQAEWSHFGYGERLDLVAEAEAAKSYQLAVDDFTRRSAETSLSGESTYAVVTLVLCTRRQLRGVSALDDRSQITNLLQDRAALLETDLMGAYIVWSPPLGGHEVLTRFPEMHAIS